MWFLRGRFWKDGGFSWFFLRYWCLLLAVKEAGLRKIAFISSNYKFEPDFLAYFFLCFTCPSIDKPPNSYTLLQFINLNVILLYFERKLISLLNFLWILFSRYIPKNCIHKSPDFKGAPHICCKSKKYFPLTTCGYNFYFAFAQVTLKNLCSLLLFFMILQSILDKH